MKKIYIGEDIDLCDKIIKIKKILYSPLVKIYHRSRDFIPFIFSKICLRNFHRTCFFQEVYF